MPHAFQSLSHGTVAFGFFNIESDMLLLENYFFFADKFCRNVSQLALLGGKGFSGQFEAFSIKDPSMVGDLMGAIHGIRFTGFIGALYKLFPFPMLPEAFRQKCGGSRTRPAVREIISGYAVELSMPFSVDEAGEEASLGPYRFSRSSFQELIRYVWRGGYPRWDDEIRPEYLIDMKKAVEKNSLGILSGISFDGV
jgi:hypothetical protein